MINYVIIGGGIAGLSAAYTLSTGLTGRRQSDFSGMLPTDTARITILESGTRWGGKIVTDRQDGFVIEGGPDTFLASKPWAVDLCQELGLESRLFGTNPQHKNTYVLFRGRLLPLPDGLTMMIPTRFGPMIRTDLLSWPQKVRMGFDFFLPSRANGKDEALGAFVTRRLGRAAYERLIEPLMSGIYAGDGDALSLQATFPYLHELEKVHGGLVKGALAVRRRMRLAAKAAPGSRSAFLTPQTGLAEIVDALVFRLLTAGVDMRLNTAATHITHEANGYTIRLANGRAIHAAAVILAAPAYASGELLRGLSAPLADELAAIPYVTTATISLAYRNSDLPRPLDGYGYVIPRREGRRALACTWTSTKFPHRAPAGHSLLRVFIGRAGQEVGINWTEPALLEVAREELRTTLGIHAAPLLSRVFRWERAMPQYNLGHPARLARIEALLQDLPGIFLAGNGYRGIGIPDCIHSGEVAARHALALQTA